MNTSLSRSRIVAASIFFLLIGCTYSHSAFGQHPPKVLINKIVGTWSLERYELIPTSRASQQQQVGLPDGGLLVNRLPAVGEPEKPILCFSHKGSYTLKKGKDKKALTIEEGVYKVMKGTIRMTIEDGTPASFEGFYLLELTAKQLVLEGEILQNAEKSLVKAYFKRAE